MNTPEQPTIWPPAPTVAPPEVETRKPFKLSLRAPDWVRYWRGSMVWFFAPFYIVRGYYEFDDLRCPHWCSFPVAAAIWFVVGGAMTAWKFKPWQRKRDL